MCVELPHNRPQPLDKMLAALYATGRRRIEFLPHMGPDALEIHDAFRKFMKDPERRYERHIQIMHLVGRFMKDANIIKKERIIILSSSY